MDTFTLRRFELFFTDLEKERFDEISEILFGHLKRHSELMTKARNKTASDSEKIELRETISKITNLEGERREIDQKAEGRLMGFIK